MKIHTTCSHQLIALLYFCSHVKPLHTQVCRDVIPQLLNIFIQAFVCYCKHRRKFHSPADMMAIIENELLSVFCGQKRNTQNLRIPDKNFFIAQSPPVCNPRYSAHHRLSHTDQQADRSRP